MIAKAKAGTHMKILDNILVASASSDKYLEDLKVVFAQPAKYNFAVLWA